MLKYVLKRALWVVMGLAVFSFIAFLPVSRNFYYIEMRVPEGTTWRDYEWSRDHDGWAHLVYTPTGEEVDIDSVVDYSWQDRPPLVQYWAWVRGIVLQGYWGYSWEWGKPVDMLLGERAALSLVLAGSAFVLGWFLALPLGTLLARGKGALFDSLVTCACRLGASAPGFLIALVAMWVGMSKYDVILGGLFSEEYILAPWSWAKVADMLQHGEVSMLVLTFYTVSRGALEVRDSLQIESGQAYLVSARTRGVAERKLMWRYPASALSVLTLRDEHGSWPCTLSAFVLVAMVLSLQTMGPMFLRACTSQDPQLEASFLLLFASLGIIGTALVDVLHAAIDPRLRTNDWQPTIEPVVGR